MRLALSIKLRDWPLIDQSRYRDARQVTSFLSGPKPARKWSPRRCRIVEQGYGQWLSFLARNGWLDPDAAPEARVTVDRVSLFVIQLQERVSSWSVEMMVEGLARMLAVMAPDQDWNWLQTIVSRLKTIAKPERDKRAHMVEARRLLALGVNLMDQALEMGDRYHAATCMRDGLLIAVLVSCPVRIANLTAVTIGEHLWFDDGSYRLSFSTEETKNGRAYEGELSPALNFYVNVYLRDHRRRLLAQSNGEKTERLWINRWGRSMHEGAIRDQIKKRTCAAFGRHVWPHLVRSIAATSFVDHDPDMVGLVPDLLGHADHQTAHKYYILADGARAHEAVQSAFEDRRLAALSRYRGRRSEVSG